MNTERRSNKNWKMIDLPFILHRELELLNVFVRQFLAMSIICEDNVLLEWSFSYSFFEFFIS